MKHNIYVVFAITFALTLLSLGSGQLFAQREQTTEVWATGYYTVSKDENITIKEAYAKALFNAKEEALRKAGVFENIHSIAIIEIGGGDENFKEINSELARIELEGRVLVKDKTEEMQSQGGLYTYITTIHADVKVEETEEDLLFDFEENGLRNTYLDGEKMTFTVTPTKDCYLRIFYFDRSASIQLFPDTNYMDILFESDVPVTFPLPNDQRYLDGPFSRPQEYTMELSENGIDIEQGVLLIIALKNRVPFSKEVTYENVIRWLFKIKRKDKRVHGYGVNIVRR